MCALETFTDCCVTWKFSSNRSYGSNRSYSSNGSYGTLTDSLRSSRTPPPCQGSYRPLLNTTFDSVGNFRPPHCVTAHSGLGTTSHSCTKHSPFISCVWRHHIAHEYGFLRLPSLFNTSSEMADYVCRAQVDLPLLASTKIQPSRRGCTGSILATEKHQNQSFLRAKIELDHINSSMPVCTIQMPDFHSKGSSRTCHSRHPVRLA
jgi:hypothetical protein